MKLTRNQILQKENKKLLTTQQTLNLQKHNKDALINNTDQLVIKKETDFHEEEKILLPTMIMNLTGSQMKLSMKCLQENI